MGSTEAGSVEQSYCGAIRRSAPYLGDGWLYTFVDTQAARDRVTLTQKLEFASSGISRSFEETFR